MFHMRLSNRVFIPKRPYNVHIAVAPTRKAERNEWMVEKMTEMGVDRIDFIVTEHTHRETVSPGCKSESSESHRCIGYETVAAILYAGNQIDYGFSFVYKRM